MTQPVQPKGISDLDDVVKDVLKDFLPSDSLLASSATNKLFQQMMNDKRTWMKLAKQLHIEPKSSETAKSEVVARLKANKNFMEIFGNYRTTENELKEINALDPIAQNEKISAFIHKIFTTPNLLSIFNDRLYRKFGDVLNSITAQSGTKEGVDPTDMEMALILIKQGIPLDYAQWQSVFSQINGIKLIGTYCPDHFNLFKELLQKFTNSDIFATYKDVLLAPVFRYGFIDQLPREFNYPYNFIEEALKVGVRPQLKYFDQAQWDCPLDLWGEKEGSPITQLLKYATDQERNAVLQKAPSWFNNWKDSLKKSLAIPAKDDIPAEKWFTKCLHRVIHWPVFIAQVQGTKVNEKERQANIDWVNQQIDAAEALSKDKKYYDSVRAQVKELSKESL